MLRSQTLRLYPAVPVDGKMADEDDVLPNGYRVIKGDGMNYMIYAMGSMKYLWGEDAEYFRPERWLANGVFQQESPYSLYRSMFKLEDESKGPIYKTMFTLHMDKGLHLFAYPREISA